MFGVDAPGFAVYVRSTNPVVEYDGVSTGHDVERRGRMGSMARSGIDSFDSNCPFLGMSRHIVIALAHAEHVLWATSATPSSRLRHARTRSHTLSLTCTWL
jgi:hypothetical protein